MKKEETKNTKTVVPEGARIETKTVKHDFTEEERQTLNLDLLTQLEKTEQLEAELKQVKSSFKAKIDEADSRTITLRTSLRNGFEMRSVRCWCQYRPEDGKKDWYREDTGEIGLTEDMTNDDYQQDLIQAESKFDSRATLQIFEPAGSDQGVLTVGKLQDRWYSALRVKIGGRMLEERLDSEQKSFKERLDAIKVATKRLKDWLVSQLGVETAKGFDNSIKALVESQKEKVE